MKHMPLLFVLLLIGCSKPTVGRDRRIASYIENFEKYYGVTYNGSVEIVKLNMSSHTTDGVCRMYKNSITKEMMINTKHSIIQLDEETYADAIKRGDTYALEQILLHEFGHCVFSRDHDGVLMPKNGLLVPRSAMYPWSFGQTNTYKNNRAYYFEELR